MNLIYLYFLHSFWPKYAANYCWTTQEHKKLNLKWINFLPCPLQNATTRNETEWKTVSCIVRWRLGRTAPESANMCWEKKSKTSVFVETTKVTKLNVKRTDGENYVIASFVKFLVSPSTNGAML